MSYLTQATIANDGTMNNRVAQAVAQEGGSVTGLSDDEWTRQHSRRWAAAPGWSEAWESSLASHAGTPAYDPARDEAVITDSMILSQIQAMLADEEEGDGS